MQTLNGEVSVIHGHHNTLGLDSFPQDHIPTNGGQHQTNKDQPPPSSLDATTDDTTTNNDDGLTVHQNTLLVESLVGSPLAKHMAMTKQEQLIRLYLMHKAKQEEEDDINFYVQERLLSFQLADDIALGLLSHPETLPDDEIQAQLLVKTIEAYYVGQGLVEIHGRHLPCYQQVLEPFVSTLRPSEGVVRRGSMGHSKGETVEQLTGTIRHIFERHFSGMLLCRAFGYAMYRLEYHQEGKESILDAYCVALYAIQLLQGKLDEFMNMQFGDVVEEELIHYKSDHVDLTADDLLWCFCMLLMRISVQLRKTLGNAELDAMLQTKYGPVSNVELLIANLAVGIRPESPASFLTSYGTLMDLKPLVPPALRENWMKTAFEFVTHGLEASENWGDPYYKYMFQIIMAYWMPTTIYPSDFSHKQLLDRVQVANKWKEICRAEVPDHLLKMGEHHEECLQYLLAMRSFDKDAPTMSRLVHAYRYPVPPLDGHGGVPPSPTQAQQQPADSPSAKNCHYCHKSCPAVSIQCSRCGQVEYCSKICQATHWRASHGDECMPQTGNACGHCGKVLQKRVSCSKCANIHYCNRKCQLAHWKGGHKKDCKLMTVFY